MFHTLPFHHLCQYSSTGGPNVSHPALPHLCQYSSTGEPNVSHPALPPSLPIFLNWWTKCFTPSPSPISANIPQLVNQMFHTLPFHHLCQYSSTGEPNVSHPALPHLCQYSSTGEPNVSHPALPPSLPIFFNWWTKCFTPCPSTISANIPQLVNQMFHTLPFPHLCQYSSTGEPNVSHPALPHLCQYSSTGEPNVSHPALPPSLPIFLNWWTKCFTPCPSTISANIPQLVDQMFHTLPFHHLCQYSSTGEPNVSHPALSPFLPIFLNW